MLKNKLHNLQINLKLHIQLKIDITYFVFLSTFFPNHILPYSTDQSTFYMVINSASGEEYMSAPAPVWENVFDMTMRQGAYFILFLLSMLYLFLKKGENLAELLFCGSTLCSFFIFLNPYILPNFG